ncbi:putative NAD(P)/FAD-binding protein YdhS [Micromonospora pisi]|uniref:Putative NAD(P)/FAD-binding protein YdhS n=1 Tax=Micromonospora pisi TaxID=589240 RepID=A0A495JKD4_9ACTN|nr:FAD/NAD(P)-binding protein [Micromonospora pisi]RKR88459.1 putative NAD(P)/FAD-binding protein YdhS [Micromonospora pisi]
MSRTVLVVGGGCSGTLVSRELLRGTSDSVVLVDPSPDPGTGIAYGPAARPWHLLNSPAGTMSADPDTPGDFVDFCRLRRPTASAGDFMPRSWYGDYLRQTLDTTHRHAAGRLRIRRDRVSRIVATTGGVDVEFESGARSAADRVVLAIGAPGSGDPVARWSVGYDGRRGYVRDPWAPGALDTVPVDRPVLLLGTGLTAVDVALSLAEAGQRAPMVAVSRHGLLPNSQRRPGPPVPAQGGLPESAPSLRQLVRQLRELVRAGADWRSVVDGLRPRLDGLWAGLSPVDRDRFLRHLARHWEVHRHRMAPEIADELDRLRASGRLTVRAATVGAVTPGPADGLEVRLEHAGRVPVGTSVWTGGEVTTFGALINCTGPGRLPGSADPLVRRLLADGLVRPGPYGLGLDVDGGGALYGRDGSADGVLWAVGPPRRGRLWETTAVPEIRGQARALATRFAVREGAPSPLAVAV